MAAATPSRAPPRVSAQLLDDERRKTASAAMAGPSGMAAELPMKVQKRRLVPRSARSLANVTVSVPPAAWSAATREAMGFDAAQHETWRKAETGETAAAELGEAEGAQDGADATELDAATRGIGPAAAAFVAERIGERQVNMFNSSAFEARLERVTRHERMHYAESSRDTVKAAVKYWLEYTVGESQLRPLRPNCASLTQAQIQHEHRLMQCFADFLGERVMPGTVESYLSVVRGWHTEITGWPPGDAPNQPNLRLRRQVTGMHRERPRPPSERLAHSTKLFKTFRAGFDDLIDEIDFVEFSDPAIPPRVLAAQISRLREQLIARGQFERFLACTALEVQTCVLGRPGEVYPSKGARLTFSDVEFVFENGRLREGWVHILPLKKRPRNRAFGVKQPMPLIMEQGEHMRALKLLAALALMSAPSHRLRATAPLLRFPAGHARRGKAIRMNFVQPLYIQMLREAGVEQPERFSKCHCPRIVGATAIAASGQFNEVQFRQSGRWGGDVAFLYARATAKVLRDMQRALGSVDAGELVRRLGDADAAADEPDDADDPERTETEADSGSEVSLNEGESGSE